MKQENNVNIKEKKVEPEFADETEINLPKTEKATQEKVLNFYKTKEDQEETLEPLPIENELLKESETSRQGVYKSYKTKNRVKSLISIAGMTIMLLAWILPGSLLKNDQGGLSLGIALGISALTLVGLAIYGNFFKKEMDVKIKDYFAVFYGNSYKYAFDDLKIENFNGNIDSKIDDEDFKLSNLYKDVFKIGSRYFSTFEYNDKKWTICDCAAQTKGQKSLKTIFVGKLLTCENDYHGEGLYIYVKGNKRALPPNNLESFNLISDNENFMVFGNEKEKPLVKSLSKEIEKIQTNKTLVDVAISIQKGKTYFALGYEDNLMVIPLQNPLDVRPFEQFKTDMKLFLNMSIKTKESK